MNPHLVIFIRRTFYFLAFSALVFCLTYYLININVFSSEQFSLVITYIFLTGFISLFAIIITLTFIKMIAEAIRSILNRADSLCEVFLDKNKQILHLVTKLTKSGGRFRASKTKYYYYTFDISRKILNFNKSSYKIIEIKNYGNLTLAKTKSEMIKKKKEKIHYFEFDESAIEIKPFFRFFGLDYGIEIEFYQNKNLICKKRI